MRSLGAAVCLLLVAPTLWGQQNRLPLHEARRYAQPCAEKAATLDDLPLPIDVDPDKPCAERGEGGGAMVIPAKSLSEAKLRQVAQDVVPVGQLWLRKWTPIVRGMAVPKDKLRIVLVSLDDQDRPMSLLLLGVRKKGAHDRELVVYAKGREPLVVVPLQKLDLVPALPVELEWQWGDQDADTLTLRILGKHQAVLSVPRQ